MKIGALTATDSLKDEIWFFLQADRFAGQGDFIEALALLKKIITWVQELSNLESQQKDFALNLIRRKILQITSRFEKTDWEMIDKLGESFSLSDYFSVIYSPDFSKIAREFSPKETAVVYLKAAEACLYSPTPKYYMVSAKDSNLVEAVNYAKKYFQKAVRIYSHFNLQQNETDAYFRIITALWEQFARKEMTNRNTVRKMARVVIEFGKKAVNLQTHSLIPEINLILAQSYHLIGGRKNIKEAIRHYTKVLHLKKA